MARILSLILTAVVVTAWSSPVAASGWNDYRLPIDPGFEIVRANSLDVMLCRTGGSVVYFHGDYAGVGPISGYVVTPTHIFTRHHGRVARNLFAGDTFEEVDPSRTFYFVVDKKAASTPGAFGFAEDVKIDGVPVDDGRPPDVFGPFDEQAFLVRPEVSAAAPLRWLEPGNPNVALPLAGSIYFLLASALYLGWPLLLLAALGLAVYMLRRRAEGARTAR